MTSANTGAMLYQLSYEATHWEQGHLSEFISSREEWNDVKWIWNNIMCTAVVDERDDHRSKFSNLSSCKEEALSSTTAVHIWYYFIFTSHHFTPHGKIWTHLSDLAPNVWLHSSVGRASHRYRGGHGFESRWSPDFFQASSFQLLKLEILLRWSSLSS